MKEVSIYIMVKPDSEMKGYFKGNVFKIGMSETPEKRLLAVDVQETPVELIAEYVLNDRDTAYKIEKVIHNILNCYKLRNEWFYLSTVHLQIIDNVLVELLTLECHYHDKSYFTTPKFNTANVLIHALVEMDKKYIINEPTYITP